MSISSRLHQTEMVFLMAAIMLIAAASACERSLSDFAPANLKPFQDQLTAEFTTKAGNRISLDDAERNFLRRADEEGAPADQESMDSLEPKNLIVSETHFDLAGNRVDLFAWVENVSNLTMEPGFALSYALGSERSAIANVSSVTADRYTKAALISPDVWEQVAEKTTKTENVRAALTFVARGEARLGIVFRRAAISSKKKLEAFALVEPGK